jgi:hypothetical protein
VSRAVTLFLVAGTLAAALVVAAPAGAARECDGLQVCVPVVGPWVVVPPTGGGARPKVEWQLTCPRRHIVAGTDAELSIRAIDIAFYGLLGSPINPGITTGRSITFVGTHVGRSSRPETYKPYIGCMPSAGGGPRIPTAVGAFPPGEAVTRRVTQARVRLGVSTYSARCRTGERLVGSSHAFGFRTRSAPGASLVSSVSGTRTVRGDRVIVRARGDAELEEVRALVQVHALCARSQ